MAYEFRRCCDSPMGDRNPHIKGCVNESKPVEVSMADLTPEGMTLRVRDFGGNILAEGATFDEVFDHPTWVVSTVIYPLENEIPSVAVENMRLYFTELNSLDKAMTEIAYSDQSYNDPSYRVLRRKKDVMKMIVSVVLYANVGVWPHQFRDLGL